MKSRWIAIFWSLVMIAAGVIFFLQEQGFIDFNLLSTKIWALIFAILSAFFFLTYFLQGLRNWGWLFPATILGSIALIMGLEGTQLGGILTGAPVMIGIAIPFVVVFLQDKKNNWWALIPAWVMTAIALVILFEDQVDGNLIGSFVMYSIALSFLVVYLIDRTHRWALIPFGSLSVIGMIPLLENFISGEAMGVFVMFLFAIPFFVVYFWSKANWWALIPAGVFTTIALVVLYTTLWQPLERSRCIDPVGTALLLSGIGLTFGALWLRREVQPTDWAKYPAVILLMLAVLSVALGANIGFFWPTGLIVSGVVILLAGFLRKPQTPLPSAAPAAPAEKDMEKKPSKKRVSEKKRTD
jgi:hypothetical protein